MVDEFGTTEQTVQVLNEQRNDRRKSIMRAIDPKTVLIFGGIILIGLWGVNQKMFTWTQVLGMVIVAAIVLYILAYREMTKGEFLTYQEAFALAFEHLRERQRARIDIPPGDIIPISAGRLRNINNEPLEWTFGFMIREISNYERIFEVTVHPNKFGVGVTGLIPLQQQGYDPLAKKDLYFPTVQPGMEQYQTPASGLLPR